MDMSAESIGRKKSVLIVDDEPLLARSVSRYLQRFGFDTVVCDAGSPALEQMTSRLFDIVITDLELPDMHGSRLIQHVEKTYTACRIVVISGHNTAPPALNIYKSLNISYLNKPFDLDHLLDHVRGTPPPAPEEGC